MLRNYFKIAWRNLTRNLRYVLVNVLGLGIGLGFGILAFQNYRYANSFDDWHKNRDRIVRIEAVKADNDALYGVCPSPLALDARQLAPVEASVRYDSRRVVVKHGEHIFNEVINFADTSFFRVFNFDLLNGSADLSDPTKVLISKEIATKYFGDQNPVGKAIILYADQPTRKPLVVGGVIDGDFKRSSIRFDFLTNLTNQLEGDKPVDYTDWKFRIDAVFLLLKHPTDRAAVETLLASFVARQQLADPEWKISRFVVEPLRSVALNGRNLRGNALYPSLPPASVWGMLAMAIMLLLTAALNFANMTIAVCNRRLREMGVRKVMGSTRTQLMVQLLAESGIICGLAVLLGMILAYPITAWYNHMWSYMNLIIDYSDPYLLAFVGGMLLFTTLLAGSYPAFYVSAFRPANIFRGTLRFGGSGLFSRIMMGIQVAISLTAVISGISFERNAEFNRTADVGYDRHNLIGAYVYDESTWRVFKTAAQNIPNIESVSGTKHLPGFGYSMKNFKLSSQPHEAILFDVGDDFTQMLQIQLREGKPLLSLQDGQSAQTVLVNETFAREFGENKPLIGQSIQMDSATYQIGGVVHDFMTNTPFRPITPAMIRPVLPDKFTYFIARVKAPHQKQVLADLEKTWKRLFPYKPFDGFYQDNALAEAESVSTNIAETMGVFALVTVLLAVSGLFSLISLNILKRMREVAIRRVLGATGPQVGWILHKNYLWILVIATFSGCAFGYFLAITLMNSVFKINNGVSSAVIILSAISVLAIAFFTIILKLLQTLKINPVTSLSSE
ncbi:ABC transporter permease [Spirosoma sp. BT702]|uniref:ABC transporter permease n=1 Tax=Spirosoma profusum TaxID=2771354 RepID=A0A926XZP2_9BACT|nr:ABC transporter permease [Spirosoma profusum]MBD2699245.1 ABC transporter permease [Spirosoma profusum]